MIILKSHKNRVSLSLLEDTLTLTQAKSKVVRGIVIMWYLMSYEIKTS